MASHKNVVAIVLGGGRGTRLFPLTSIRSKPAVPLAGKYRLIDIPLSNCINSGLEKIYVLTQFMSQSLHTHIRRTYSFDPFSGGFVEILAAQQTMEKGTDWFEGTADAVRKTLAHIDQPGIEYVAILSGDQLYRMDYSEMVQEHIKTGADVTIAGLPVTREEARGFGVMRLDDDANVVGFLEKPQTDEEMDIVRMDPSWIDKQGVESKGRDCVASMGIYVFNKQSLIELLTKTSYTDFGKEVFPAAIRARKVKMHMFDGYWEDIGTIRSFFNANLELTSDNPPFDFQASNAPIYTRARFLPPTKMGSANITNSLIADGCIIGKNVTIENSVVGLRCIVGDNVTIRNSIVMGADFFDSDLSAYGDVDQTIPLGFGEGSVIESAIVDKNARIGKNAKVTNSSKLDEFDEADGRCFIRDGIPVVVKGSVLPDGWSI